MYHINILSVGKTKEKWLQEAIIEYEKRLKSIVKFTYIYSKDNFEFAEKASKQRILIILDPNGVPHTSEEFSNFLVKSLEKGGSRLSFAIGGPEGIPFQLMHHNYAISFSPMVFTHQMTRLLLIEQIYRGLEIQKGSKYHKA